MNKGTEKKHREADTRYKILHSVAKIEKLIDVYIVNYEMHYKIRVKS